METKKLKQVQIGVVILAIIIGTLLHFVFEWSGKNAIIASFSAVNESVWEHLKLVFFPMLVLGIIEYFILGRKVNNYIEGKMIGIFSAILFVIVFFYTYSGVLGINFLLVDIVTFIISIVLGEWVAYRIMIMQSSSDGKTRVLSFMILLYFLVCFIIFTYHPPKVNLFKDPETLTYSYQK